MTISLDFLKKCASIILGFGVVICPISITYAYCVCYRATLPTESRPPLDFAVATSGILLMIFLFILSINFYPAKEIDE